MGKNRKSSQETSNSWDSHTRPPEWALPSYKDSVTEADRIYRERKGSGLPGLSDGTRGAIDGINRLPGQWDSPSSSENNLQGWADGSMVGNNPQFQAALQNQLDKVAGTVNSQIAGAGRSGSGANTSILANELGNVATQAYSNQYNQDVNNMFRANQQVDQGRFGRLQGQGDAWDRALRGNGVQDKWNIANDQRGWDELNRWQDSISRGTGGASDSWGSGNSRGSTTQPGNKWQGVGGAIGSGLGLIGKSDIRAKENIEYLGDKNGHKWYEFSYKDNPAQRYRGVMAQDVVKVCPEAVFVDPEDGYMFVDYGLLGLRMETV